MNIKQFCLINCLLVTFISFAQKDIFDVARTGTIEEVKALMKINSDTINTANKEGYVPLTLACYKGNTEVALFLASEVNDIDGNSDYGTPLMAAVYKNRPVIIERLLELNANPNIADVNGTTPLHYAIIFRNEKIIKLLMDAKADVDFKDKRGNSAKEYAAMTNNKSIIDLINKK
ncbi:ankyrin repeat domain-containing protein [Psychroserpens sp. AS72]|uniref:ankyrin repeat domain-containing protein n=1 Tax=Psychroserpens sp. AS72 TaxID=3135775 RepID=UPI00317FF3F7